MVIVFLGNMRQFTKESFQTAKQKQDSGITTDTKIKISSSGIFLVQYNILCRAFEAI